MISGVRHIGVGAADDDRGTLCQRQHAVVLQQHHTLLRRLQSQRPVLFASNHAHGTLSDLRLHAKERPQDIVHRPVDVLLVQKALLQALPDVSLAVFHGKHHLQIQPCPQGMLRVVYAPDKVAHDKAVKSPLPPENVSQKLLVLTAVVLLVTVVGAHDTLSAGVHALLEMGQIHLVEGPVVDVHIHIEPQILHTVQRKVFHAGDHSLLLKGDCQRSAKLSQKEGILPVALLGSPPAGIAHQVDADAGKKVRPLGDGLVRDGLSHPILQGRVKNGGPHH